MKTIEALSVTPYVDGLEHGVSESVFLANLYSNVQERYRKGVDDLYEQIFKHKNEIHHKLTIIRGDSGCGKSTLVGKLIDELKNDKNQLTYKIDLAKATGGNYYFMGNEIINRFGHLTLGKFLEVIKTSVSEEINSIIEKIDGESYDDLKNRIIELKQYFESIQDKFFHNLSDKIEASLNNFNYSEVYSLFEQELTIYLDKGLDELEENAYLIHACINALALLFLIFRFKWSKVSGDRDKRFFVVVDSIEHVIGRDVIFDKDIDNIINKILVTLVKQEESLDRYRFKGKLSFNDIFKLIVTCRNSTISMVSNNLDDDDYRDTYSIDVSDWYSASDIVQKRAKYFNNVDDIENLQLINKILGYDDSIQRTRLLQMHNHNKRRLFEYLCDIVKDNKALSADYELLSKYMNINGAVKDSLKFGRRNMIQGWLLSKIKETDYFTRLKVISDDKEMPNGHFITRKILTYLEYKAALHNNDDGYVSFYELIHKALNNGGNITESMYDDITDVLLALSESERDDNHWCQLVLLKYNDEGFSRTKLKDKLKTASESENKYAVKITSAGKYMVNLMSSFEYFSVRYSAFYRPLFDSKLLNVDKVTNVLEKVRDCAFTCIKRIKENDDNFFKRAGCNIDYNLMYEMPGQLRKTGDGFFITHIESIIDKHISYLDAYRRYIIICDIDNNSKKDITKKILYIIESYCDMYETVLGWEASGNSRYIRGSDKKDKAHFYKVNLSIAKNNLERNIMDISVRISKNE